MPRSRNLKPNVFYDCAGCGARVERYMTPYDQQQYPPKYCTRACARRALSGARHHAWRGGRRVTSQGYVMVYAPTHPNANSHGCVLEHRLVMEKMIGRYLEPSEVVHHINSDRQDNRPGNLQLFPSNAEHKAHDVGVRRRDDFGRLLPMGATA